MKKMFLVVMDYEENTDSMFTDVGVEVTFDNQLYHLKESGHISQYADTVAYEVAETDFKKMLELVED